MKLSLGLEIKTSYHLQLRRVTTGEVIQDIRPKNLILKQFLNNIGLTNSQSYGNMFALWGIGVGRGSGTPANTDTGMFTQLWIPGAEHTTVPVSSVTTVFNDEKTIGTATITTTFPASASYVGVITELGIMAKTNSRGNTLFITHALLQDSEGNPISINKTDLDELLITAILQVSLTATDFVVMPLTVSKFGGLVRSTGDADRLLYKNFLHMGRTKKNLMGANAGTVSGDYSSDSNIQWNTLTPGMTWDSANMKMVATNSRILADAGNVHYFNSLCLNYFGCWPLPNANIFPFYTINDISIGVGDGTTKIFNNPLNYFVENSEVITVGGVTLTRGTDYTIDFENNASGLLELSAGNLAVGSSDADAVVDQTTYYPLFKACDGSSIQCSDTGNRLSATKPLILSLTTAKKVNTLRLIHFNRKRSDYNYNENLTSASFKLSYSNDNVTYTEIITTGLFDADTGQTFTFNTVSAKYFKLEVVDEPYLSTNEYYYYYYDNMSSTDTDMPFLGYIGDATIVFTTAPADQAEIKMSVQMDRPFKNANFVIDVTGDFNLTI